MKKTRMKIIAVSILLALSSQLFACDSILKDKNNDDNVSNALSVETNNKMTIKIELEDASTISIDLDGWIDEDLLSRLNTDELVVLRYAYYAKYDYEFSDSTYTDYFSQFSWYEPINKNVDNKLTLIDKENINLIKQYEDKLTTLTKPTPSTNTPSQTVPNNTVPSTESNTSNSHEIILDLGYGDTIVIDLDRRISGDLLWELTAEELAIVRNGYYAKYGYIFSTQSYANYFMQYSWYNPISKNVESKLTSLDKENIALVQEYENYLTSYDVSEYNVNYYVWLFLCDGDVVALDLDQKISEDLLWQLDSDYLAVLRNAYYAKHGYIFSKQMYHDYFIQYDWYNPTSKNVESSLTQTDKDNIALIQKYE